MIFRCWWALANSALTLLRALRQMAGLVFLLAFGFLGAGGRFPKARRSASKRSENAIIPRWLTVHHTRGGTLSEGRGTGFHSTLPRNSAAVLAARALVPNPIDGGIGAFFEHRARALGEAAVSS